MQRLVDRSRICDASYSATQPSWSRTTRCRSCGRASILRARAVEAERRCGFSRPACIVGAIGLNTFIIGEGISRQHNPLMTCEGPHKKNPRSPGTRKRQAPILRAIVRTLIAGYGLRTTAPEFDAPLWLAAHQDGKISALAGLRAQRLVR